MKKYAQILLLRRDTPFKDPPGILAEHNCFSRDSQIKSSETLETSLDGQGKEPLWQGNRGHVRHWQRASLSPRAGQPPSSLHQPRSRVSMRQMGTALAKPTPATPQAGKEPGCQKSGACGCPRWGLQGDASGCLPAAQSGISSPRTRRSDVYTFCPSHRSGVNHRESFLTGHLTKRFFHHFKGRWHHQHLPNCWGQKPRRYPWYQPPSCWCGLQNIFPVHPLTPSSTATPLAGHHHLSTSHLTTLLAAMLIPLKNH